jgi:hypothetical protein
MKATWIWYPGDFEVWLGNKFNNRRTERGAMFPPFWKQDSHWPTVVFSKDVDLAEDNIITIIAEGQYNFSIDGRLQMPHSNSIPKGRHTVSFKVWKQATPPALFIKGKEVQTDGTWLVTYEDKIWIDEQGTAHGSGVYVPVGYWNFDSPETPPSQYRLEREEHRPVSEENLANYSKLSGILYDFGRETFGRLKLKGLEGGKVEIYYGESREEALDEEHCETLDTLASWQLERMTDKATRTYELDSKAFRYVFIKGKGETWYDDVLMDHEYAPFDPQRSGTFRCNDDLLNRIWQVSARTLELTTQEFFMDGIKRDRWVWSGDAIQSYLMNYYLHFDTDCVKRTIRQLRGKDPVTAHINTIMDYTFYWFKSVADYYEYTADKDFISETFPRMVTLMDYVLRRTNADGLAEAQPGDWIFVDWADFPMRKQGALCFEQILLWKALKSIQACATIVGSDTAQAYAEKADALLARISTLFWSSERHAYIHAIEGGKPNEQVTKFPNMFAILCGVASEEQCRQIMRHVMLNPAVDAITTPYMRFYELDALCSQGCHEHVLRQMKGYWGGMLREGATTFWEKYNPEEHGTEHLAMYGRPYGKSLCHAWGASPIYILGRHFLGVTPTRPGYEEYEVRPCLGGLEWMEGHVPTPFGRVYVKADASRVTVRSDGGKGTIIAAQQRIAINKGETVTLNIT